MNPSAESVTTFKQSIHHYVVPVLGTLLVTVCSIQASQTHGVVGVWWWIGTVVSLAGVSVRAVYRERQTSAAIWTADQVANDLAARLHQEGQALVDALAELTSSRDRHERLAALRSLITQACQVALDCCGRSTAERRAVFYRLTINRLERERYHGRLGSNPPRQDFQAGRSPHDDEALRHATGEDVLIVNDLLSCPPAHFMDARGRSYRSFIAMPVRAGKRSFGLLAVDADKEEAFTHCDAANLALIARVLASAISHCDALGDFRGPLSVPMFRPTDLAAPDIVCGPL